MLKAKAVFSPVSAKISGLYGSSFSLWLKQNLETNLNETHLIVTASKIEAERIFSELALFFPAEQIAYLPSYDALSYQDISPHTRISSSKIRCFC